MKYLLKITLVIFIICWSFSNTYSQVTDLLTQFNLLLEQADDAFENAPGYQEAARTASGNPMEKPSRIMRQAKDVALKMTDPAVQFISLFRVVYSYSAFAKAAFAYTHKSGFINDAGKTLTQAASLVPSIQQDFGDIKAGKMRSIAYKGVADSWRELTKAALWGDHPYNKMYCDSQTKKYYDLALNEDRENAELKKTINIINAPKKPIPAKVAESISIPENDWAVAEMDRQAMVAETEMGMEKEREPQGFYTQVANIFIEAQSGTVSIKKSGSDSWDVITDGFCIIMEGDKIKTSEDAIGVSITYEVDNTFFAIKPGCEVQVFTNKLCILRGESLITVTKKGRKFMVITPTCAVGVRGTQFEVNVNADRSTETYLYEGVVEMRNANDIGYLVPGQKMIAKKGEQKLQQSSFNANNRKATNWANIDAQYRQHEQITSSQKPGLNQNANNNSFNQSNLGNTSPGRQYEQKKLSQKPRLNQNANNNSFNQSNLGNTSPNNSNPVNNPSPSDFWSIQTYSDNLQTFEQQVTSTANKGFVPVGLNCTDSQLEVLFLGGGILNISTWNMEWYYDVSSLQTGITNNMNQGYIPVGFSWNGSAYYVLYIMTDLTGQSWQIVPSALDLNAVTAATQPFVDQNYLPMGITIFGDEYYTLLVQFSEPLANKWFIEGYHDNRSEIANAINARISETSVPWGILKSGGVANVLYIGF